MELSVISYAEALKRHPQEVAQLLAKLRGGTSKHKNASPDQLVWQYRCCLQISGYSFAEVLAGKAKSAAVVYNELSFDERLADRVDRMSTSLWASIGRWWSGIALHTNPPEVTQAAREFLLAQVATQAAYDTLTPEDKAKQFKEVLEKLSGTPGFVGVNL